MRLSFHIFAAFLTTACAPITPQPTPATTVKAEPQYPANPCYADMMPVPTGVCGTFTITGKFACATCPGYGGCVDMTDVVYCATSCADPLCR